MPGPVKGVGGSGTLTGVSTLTWHGGGGFCGVLTTGLVDCWGYGVTGELGDGTFQDSTFPVAVEGVGGTGSLTGMTSLATGGDTVCGLLSIGDVVCWGYGYEGQLGNGSFYTTGNNGSAIPVVVQSSA